MECNVCKKKADLRYGTCFKCASAESVIDEGLDMDGKGLDGSNIPAKTAMEKLKLLVQIGWTGKK